MVFWGLLVCCYLFWVITRMLWCNGWLLGCCYVLSRQLLECSGSGWLLVRC